MVEPEGASWDTPYAGCRPGTLELATYVRARWPGVMCMEGPYGCANDRGVTGNGSIPSLHREGRALDLGVRGPLIEMGWARVEEVVHTLVIHAAQVGVQRIIWRRRTWTCGGPLIGWHETGERNGGAHLDHAHVELLWVAARHLTIDHLVGILGPIAGKGPLSGLDEDMIFVRDAADPGTVYERIPGGTYQRVPGQDFYGPLRASGVDLDDLPSCDLSELRELGLVQP